MQKVGLSERTDLRIRMVHNKKKMIDMRIFLSTSKYDGPSKSGFRLSPEKLDEFIDKLIAFKAEEL